MIRKELLNSLLPASKDRIRIMLAVLLSVLPCFMTSYAMGRDDSVTKLSKAESSFKHLPDTQTLARAESLRHLLQQNNDAYYNQDHPVVSDSEYDGLYQELVQLEKEYPELITPDSPTQKVGGNALPQFAPVLHQLPMYSLSKAYSFEALRHWEQNIKALINQQSPQLTVSYVVEPKFDGLAISCRYVNGKLVEGSTRGDGKRGENVLKNIKTITSIPQQLNLESNGDLPSQIEVRGEAIMPVSRFLELNEELKRKNQPVWATPRNAAAGSLRQKDPSITALRKLDAVFYTGILESQDAPGVKTQWEMLNYLEHLGFQVSPYRKQCASMDCVESYIHEWDKQRALFPIATDGVVIKVDTLMAQQILGHTAKAPNWAIAFKFQPESKEAIVQNIEFQQGRAGQITPIAIIQPIIIGGTRISRINLHSPQYLMLKDIRIGDTVLVHKAGEIIPEILAVEFSKRPAHTTKPTTPTALPSDSPYLNLCHWVERDVMNIVGLGPGLLQVMVQSGHVSFPEDLYTLTTQDIVTSGHIGEKSAQKIYNNIQQSKEQPYAMVLFALSIPNVGKTTALALSQRFVNIQQLAQASLTELQAVPDVGETTAKSIVNFFKGPQNLQRIERLKQLGLNL